MPFAFCGHDQEISKLKAINADLLAALEAALALVENPDADDFDANAFIFMASKVVAHAKE